MDAVVLLKVGAEDPLKEVAVGLLREAAAPRPSELGLGDSPLQLHSYLPRNRLHQRRPLQAEAAPGGVFAQMLTGAELPLLKEAVLRLLKAAGNRLLKMAALPLLKAAALHLLKEAVNQPLKTAAQHPLKEAAAQLQKKVAGHLLKDLGSSWEIHLHLHNSLHHLRKHLLRSHML